MFRRGRLSDCLTALLILLVMSQPQISKAKGSGDCEPSYCGHVHNISYPFRLDSDPPSCGDRRYELVCENNLTAALYFHSIKYYVQAINYHNYTIRLVDAAVQEPNCSSLPQHTLTRGNFSSKGPYSFYNYKRDDSHSPIIATPMAFLSCPDRIDSALYVDYGSCINKSSTSRSHSHSYSYVWVGGLYEFGLRDGCRIDLMAMTSLPIKDYREQPNIASTQVHRALVYGFELSWFRIRCGKCKEKFCYLDGANKKHCESTYRRIPLKFIVLNWMLSILIFAIRSNITLRIICGIPCALTILIYKFRRRHLSMFNNIEDYLRSQNNLIPIRYSYPQVKKMTKGFKEKLGEGGYGSVYKGRLRSGGLVAIKVLGKTKANGQEFINEVATIGRIHHVNVVKLVGYCAERSKRALVYDFMPNGSLEKYIFPREEGIIPLSCAKLYEISLGVARGIEYLHRGCDIHILHFDIKPQNILLDENFTPKVSDFGLAKLYPTEDSIVSLTAARGTMGYMAPELFYKNIGGVSHKADVYSFGMLVLEMAGRRKNLNVFTDHTSQIYFPSWAYNQISEGKDIEMGDATEEEREMVKKMIIVALWCTQMKPADRPSMNKVIEMLEGNINFLQMPPKPNLCPEEMPSANTRGINSDHEELPIQLSDSVSLVITRA